MSVMETGLAVTTIYLVFIDKNSYSKKQREFAVC